MVPPICHQLKRRGKLTQKNFKMHKSVLADDTIPDGAVLSYVMHEKIIIMGSKKDGAIYCFHCEEVVSPTQFEAHAGFATRRKPYMHIYTFGGVSLHQLSLEISKSRKSSRKSSCLLRVPGSDPLEEIACDMLGNMPDIPLQTNADQDMSVDENAFEEVREEIRKKNVSGDGEDEEDEENETERVVEEDLEDDDEEGDEQGGEGVVEKGSTAVGVDNRFQQLVAMFGDSCGFVSKFVNSNLNLFSKMDRYAIEVVDYVFHTNLKKDEEFYNSSKKLHLVTRDDMLLLYPNTEINYCVLNAICFMINSGKCEISSGCKTSRFAFSLDHSSALNEILRNPSNKEYEDEVLGAWAVCIDMTSVDRLMSADLILIPFCVYEHYALVVINFASEKIQYLDNIIHVEPEAYLDCARTLQQLMASFLKTKGHSKAGLVETFQIEDVQLIWKSKESNKDCGVFLMHHLMKFDGEVFSELLDLSEADVRTYLRAVICSQIVASESNILREVVMEKVFDFYREKAKLLEKRNLLNELKNKAAEDKKRKQAEIAYDRRKSLRSRTRKD